jgi:hypothetical protein
VQSVDGFNLRLGEVLLHESLAFASVPYGTAHCFGYDGVGDLLLDFVMVKADVKFHGLFLL